jgi:hypothetical protein
MDSSPKAALLRRPGAGRLAQKGSQPMAPPSAGAECYGPAPRSFSRHARAVRSCACLHSRTCSAREGVRWRLRPTSRPRALAALRGTRLPQPHVVPTQHLRFWAGVLSLHPLAPPATPSRHRPGVPSGCPAGRAGVLCGAGVGRPWWPLGSPDVHEGGGLVLGEREPVRRAPEWLAASLMGSSRLAFGPSSVY